MSPIAYEARKKMVATDNGKSSFRTYFPYGFGVFCEIINNERLLNLYSNEGKKLYEERIHDIYFGPQFKKIFVKVAKNSDILKDISIKNEGKTIKSDVLRINRYYLGTFDGKLIHSSKVDPENYPDVGIAKLGSSIRSDYPYTKSEYLLCSHHPKLINLSTNEVIADLSQYDKIYPREQGFIITEKDGLYGMMKFNGEVILKTEYYKIGINDSMINKSFKEYEELVETKQINNNIIYDPVRSGKYILVHPMYYLDLSN